MSRFRWLIYLFLLDTIFLSTIPLILGAEVTCQVVVAETTLTTNSSNSSVVCIPIENGKQGNNYYPLPNHLVDKLSDLSYRGDLLVRFPTANLTSHELIIPHDAKAEVVSHVHRELSSGAQTIRTTGIFSLALIRVSTKDSRPSVGAKEYFREIFESRTSMVNQFRACSKGKVHFKPAIPHVINVHLNVGSTLFKSRNSLLAAVSDHVKKTRKLERLGDLADKVFIMLPKLDHLGAFIAFGGMGHFRSVYSDDWAISLSSCMHEIGHSFGLLHAQILGSIDSYKDTSGYMGAGDRRRNFPRKCFNGFHMSKLSWLEDETLEFDPTRDGPRLVRISAFSQTARGSSQEVNIFSLIKVRDLHLMYNRATGANHDTPLYRNQLTITKGNIHGAANSMHMAALSENQVWRDFNFANSANTLVVEVCQDVRDGYDSMIVSIGLGKSYCGHWDLLWGEPATKRKRKRKSTKTKRKHRERKRRSTTASSSYSRPLSHLRVHSSGHSAEDSKTADSSSPMD